MVSFDTVASRSAENKARRRAAAEWVASMTGSLLPTESDGEFRSCLRDGVTLCRLMHSIRPDLMPAVTLRSLEDDEEDPERMMKTMHLNIEDFLTALRRVGISHSLLFTEADLAHEGAADKVHVADCLLQLKRYAEERGSMESPAARRGGTPHGASTPTDGSSRRASFSSHRISDVGIGLPRANTSSPDHLVDATSDESLRGSLHMTKLLNNFTAALKERMTTQAENKSRAASPHRHRSEHLPPHPTRRTSAPSAQASPAASHDAYAPMPPFFDLLAPHASSTDLSSLPETEQAVAGVVANVLTELTQEYERRLLEKDQHVKVVQDALGHERAMRAQAEGQAGELRSALSQLTQEMRDLESTYNARPPVVPAGSTLMNESDVVSMQRRNADLESRLARVAQSAALVNELRIGMQQMRDETSHGMRSLGEELAAARTQLDALQGVTARYRALVEENRYLYNQIQDLRGNIRVFCRVRPAGVTGDPSQSCVDVGVDSELALYEPGRVKTRRTFKFDKVFAPRANQNDVYEEVAPLVRSVLDGYNVCIFAYGQTGSGKTFTMSGPPSCKGVDESRGINYRTLDDLFHLMDKRSTEVEYSIHVQMLEIYNEQLRDLLVTNGEQRKLEVRSTEKTGNNVPDAVRVPVACTQDVLQVMSIGESNRSFGETKMNERSSRSHCVLMVAVHSMNRVTGVKSLGCLNLIDLAGSERVSRSEAVGERLKEAQHINKSLAALGDVMAALATKTPHVPYRNSKLTHLLQDSLAGQAKTMMFIHVAPESSSFNESCSTLTFGTRVAQIQLGAARRNTESAELFAAREQVARMQEKMHEVGSVEGEMERLRSEVRALRAAEMERERVEMDNAELRREVAALRAAQHAMREQAAVLQAQVALNKRVRASSTGVASPPSRPATHRAGNGTSQQQQQRMPTPGNLPWRESNDFGGDDVSEAPTSLPASPVAPSITRSMAPPTASLVPRLRLGAMPPSTAPLQPPSRIATPPRPNSARDRRSLTSATAPRPTSASGYRAAAAAANGNRVPSRPSSRPSSVEPSPRSARKDMEPSSSYYAQPPLSVRPASTSNMPPSPSQLASYPVDTSLSLSVRESSERVVEKAVTSYEKHISRLRKSRDVTSKENLAAEDSFAAAAAAAAILLGERSARSVAPNATPRTAAAVSATPRDRAPSWLMANGVGETPLSSYAARQTSRPPSSQGIYRPASTTGKRR